MYSKNVISTLFILTGLTFSSGFHLKAEAQTKQQTLGECTNDLRRQRYSRKDALKNCAEILQYQPVSQNLGECTNDLRRQRYSRDDASQACNWLLQKQMSRTNQQNTTGTSVTDGNGTVINIYNGGQPNSPQTQQQQQPQKTAREVCVTPVGTYNRNMTPCNLGVSGFTKKVIYE